MIQLYCCYTEAHKVLFDQFFVPSLTNNIIVHAYQLDVAGDGDFLSVEFLSTIQQKVELIIKSLERHRGQIILWSDIDIVFFESPEDELRKMLEVNSWDIAFQAEGYHTSDVNSGFFAVRCNQRSIDFFKAVSQRMHEEPGKNEQPIVNDLLYENTARLKWGKLPYKYSARSHNWPPPDEKPVLYHANCTAGKNGVEQKINQFKDLKDYHSYQQYKVCIVTPELEGPRRNSGIGTHVFYFSQYLKSLKDHDVTIFLSTESYIPCPVEGKEWEDHYYETYGVHLVLIQNQVRRYPQIGWFSQWFCERSLIVSHYLEQQSFDLCYFQDLNADAFHTIQSRTTGLGFQKSVISTMLNGPNLWAKQGMKQFAHSMVDDPLVNFCESYCLKNSDLVTAPSNYAIQWCRDQGWDLPQSVMLTPYMINTRSKIKSDYSHKATDEIIFFGRLEVRKGLLLFLNALQVLANRGEINGIRRVHFLGNHTRFMDFDSQDIIYDYFQGKLSDLSYTIHADLDHVQAMNFLKSNDGALVVTPSYSETLGYTLIESLVLSANLVATNTSAIPELFKDRGRLCKPEPKALAKLIELGLRGLLPPVKASYNPKAASEAWENAHLHCLNLLMERKAMMQAVICSPLVSVCVPHYNYGAYLPAQLESLKLQTYHNMEVLVADDGSTDELSIAVFRELEQHHATDNFDFIRHPNVGLCETRNDLARRAKGDYVIFCDADNISKPRMVELLLHAILRSNADCITCHMEKFTVDPTTGERSQLDHYTPLGACLEAAPFVDPFGDANFIIRKDVYEAIGGFRTVSGTASEDWEFLTELVFQGYKLEVIPADLFEYREHANSNMRQTNYYDTRMRTLKPFFDRMDDWQGRILYNAVGIHEYYSQRLRMGQICQPEEVEERLRDLRIRIESKAAQDIHKYMAEKDQARRQLKKEQDDLNDARRHLAQAEEDKTRLQHRIKDLELEKSNSEQRSEELEKKCNRLINNPFQAIGKKIYRSFKS